MPKRPDPLGANATLQYAVVCSTALAAGYAITAARFKRRVTPTKKVSRTALFVGSSGRLGLWAIGLGAAANVYYHRSFTTIVVSQTVKDPTPPKVYERTEKYTVEDACLAGAAAGFVTFLPTLFIRRPIVPWWTRIVGMSNIGACTGVLASLVYFRRTDEGRRALEELDRQRRRRTLEFHHIFWDKMLMQQFDPLIQGYIRHNGIFRAYNLPAEAYDAPENFGILSTPTPAADPNTTTTDAVAAHANAGYYRNARYYLPSPDWIQHLQAVNPALTQSDIEQSIRDKHALLKEAEFVAYYLSQKQYAYVHTTHTDEADKQTRLREIQLLAIACNRLRAGADEIDCRISTLQHWLRQKAALEARAPREAWLADHPSVPDTEAHDPSLSIEEMRKFDMQVRQEISHFEMWMRSQVREDVERRDIWSRDLEDARTMLRAVDRLSWELEERRSKMGLEGKVEAEAVEPAKADVAKGEELAKTEEAPQSGTGEDEKKEVEHPPEGMTREKP